MKKRLLLLLALLLPLCALAEETDSFYDHLPEGVQQVLAAEYDGWSVPDGARLYEDGRAVLLVMSKDEKNIAVILEQREGRFEVAAVSDAIIPDPIPTDVGWWIQDTWSTGEPYLWYMPKSGAHGFYLELRRDDRGQWIVDNGFFGSGSFTPDTLSFKMDNRGTALRISGESYFSPVYVPVDVDLTFENFDHEAVKAFCAEAMTQKNMPGLIPSTLEADAFPQGRAVDFPKGEKYPVYAGPGESYERLGEQHNASVSTNDWIQVFGWEGDWLLIQYNVANGRNRFGYIPASALSGGVGIPELNFGRRAGVLNGWITDDPLRTAAEIGPGDGVACVCLATFGDEWLYVETTDPDLPRYRGFASVECVYLPEDQAGKAAGN